MMKKKIAVIAGGDSGEFEISMKSGSMVAGAIDPEKYEVFLIRIKGKDWLCEKDGKMISVDKNDFSLSIDGQRVNFDCVFCAIHGTPGENGKLPAYFELLHMAYTSCDSLISALTFNKHLCNRVVGTLGVNVSRSLHFYKSEIIDHNSILKALQLPVFVKPNAGGSSVGMSKVNGADDLLPAIKRAFTEDTEILIEEYVEGRELTCGVMEVSGRMYVFPICEIRSKKEYFDFEAKYNPALAEEILPAPIPGELEIEIKETSAYLYKKLNCKGVVRFDYIYASRKRKLFFLEVNTVPGLTGESIVPKMAREMGIPLTELFGMLIEDAIERNIKR